MPLPARKLRQRRTLIALATAIIGAATGAPAAQAATTTSSNWAGYAVSSSRFSRVAGSWVVPTANCTAGSTTYSAVWVGLGGYRATSEALEQTGTDADCTGSGRATYSAWYELVPAGTVRIRLTVHAGDRISASVRVHGRSVTLRLADTTTRASFVSTRQMSAPDVSSAEWIVEAPSSCDQSGNCQTLALTDFSSVSFSGASATSGGHTGSISDGRWRTTRLDLSSDGGGSSGPGFAQEASAAATATPGSLEAGGSSFSVAFAQTAATAPAAGGQPVDPPGPPPGPDGP